MTVDDDIVIISNSKCFVFECNMGKSGLLIGFVFKFNAKVGMVWLFVSLGEFRIIFRAAM
jgi:hypothetical protein